MRSVETVKAELKAYQTSMHPKLRDYSPLSVLSILNESVARQIVKLEELIEEKAKSLSILTATGEDLDALVRDRLTDGRLPGEKASGSIKFERYIPATADIEISKGTRVRVPRENLVFQTIETGYIREGETSVTVSAVAEDYGSKYNVAAYTITQMLTRVWGVDAVYNELPFEGGKDEETDDELRERYINSILIPGKATQNLIEQRLTELTGVYEARVLPAGPGEVEIVVDTVYTQPPHPLVSETIRQNIAAGIVSRGILAAEIGETIRVGLARSGGGDIYVRPREFIPSLETITITYVDTDGNNRLAAVNVPAATLRGSGLKCYMEAGLATEIAGIDYGGSSEYDVLIGLGDYPYLWTTPRKVPVSVEIMISKDYSAATTLEQDIEESVRSFLDNFTIGRRLEYSDLLEAIYVDFASGRRFAGIEEIRGCTAVGKDQILTKLGDRLEIDSDERIEPGIISVHSE